MRQTWIRFRSRTTSGSWCGWQRLAAPCTAWLRYIEPFPCCRLHLVKARPERAYLGKGSFSPIPWYSTSRMACSLTVSRQPWRSTRRLARHHGVESWAVPTHSSGQPNMYFWSFFFLVVDEVGLAVFESLRADRRSLVVDDRLLGGADHAVIEGLGDGTMSLTARMSLKFLSMYAGALPAPTPKAGLPQVYAALTMPLPPVPGSWQPRDDSSARSGASMEGCSIHCMQFLGAPASSAASRMTMAAASEHSWACGGSRRRLVLCGQVRSGLEDGGGGGLMTGVTPPTTPTGSAISLIPMTSSLTDDTDGLMSAR